MAPASGQEQPVLETQQLCFSFHSNRVLDQVNMHVNKGQFVVLLGANGAGKTTLFSLITGLYATDLGDVFINGNNLRTQTEQALSQIGVVFQQPTIDRDLSVSQNLRYFCQLQGLARSDATTQITRALEQHGLSELAGRKVTQLSGGQQRRLELARSLLHKPALLLMDEPTVGLDHESRIAYLKSTLQLCRDRKTGVLWATHLMDEVASADYLYLLHDGKIVANGVIPDLLARHNQTTLDGLYRHLTQSDTATSQGLDA